MIHGAILRTDRLSNETTEAIPFSGDGVCVFRTDGVSVEGDYYGDKSTFYKNNKARAERAAQSMDASAEYRAAAQEVSALSMRLAKAEYIRADAHKILQLKKQLETAKEKRRAVLAQLGLKQGEEKRRIFCDKCGDTGFLTNGRQCSCVAAHEAQIRAYAAEAKRCKATV